MNICLIDLSLQDELGLMEPIEVTARFDREGKVTPLRFTWLGSEYLVESTGRRWEVSDALHILVMVPDGRMFELIFTPSSGSWFLGSTQSDRLAA